MYAIIEIAGCQYRVSKDDVISVPRLEGNEGEAVAADKVRILAVDSDGKLTLGAPYVEGSVAAKIVGHDRGGKIIVFKKKRRKGYRVKNGHRQDFTRIEIGDISLG